MSGCLVNRRSTAVILAAGLLVAGSAQMPAGAQQLPANPSNERAVSNSMKSTGAMSATRPVEPAATRSIAGAATPGPGEANPSTPTGLTANPNK